MLRSFTILAPLVALAGCPASDNSDASMVVLQNTGVASGATTCTFTGITGQPSLSHGQISTASTAPYLLTPLIESRITATAGSELQRTILVEGADVHLSVPSASVDATNTPITLSPANADFQTLFSGSVAPNNGTTNVTMNLIPLGAIAEILQQAAPGAGHLHAEVVAQVGVYGKLGGDRVEALPFQYAVTVCNDCVVNVIGMCPSAGTIRPGDPCNVFQDLPVDCCTETSGALTCPARAQ